MKKILFLVLFISVLDVYPQDNTAKVFSYPQNYFRSPLDIPLYLSGTFGELRSNHFHSGLDIKTAQKEGLNVYTAAEGYISRIKISVWGYGKAIYVTHPNGYTTVYAHLKKFNRRIEDYVKKQQYKKESFEIQLFPSATSLPVSKNEIIAFSGSTGGFAGPHLHFEIRNTKTEKPINPMLFGFNISDSKKPRINSLIGYALNDNSHINKLNNSSKITILNTSNGDLIAKKIIAHGDIGFGINAYDQQDGSFNKNGLYSLEVFVNGTKTHVFKTNSFSFSESKYINLLIDYKRYSKLKQRIQKCFTEPLNKLSMYSKSTGNGVISIKDGMNYTVEIIAKDFKGNSQKIKIPIIGKKNVEIIKTSKKVTPYKINFKEFNKFSKEGVTIAFPKNTFYENLFLDFNIKDSLVTVHTPSLPLHKNYTLTFDVSKYTEQAKNQLYIASFNDKGTPQYNKTVKKENTFYTNTKTLGTYGLVTDTDIPEITLKNFKTEQWVTHFKTLKVKIADKQSGINSYRAEIDGKWALMEYNVKTGLLTYNLSDRKFDNAKHNLKIVITDNVGNINTLNSIFYRKK